MTFSLLARDPATGALACTTATGLPAIGAFVPHVREGAGAIATQGFATNRLYGPDGLELLARGWSAQESLDAVIHRDCGRDFRQCLMLDRQGGTAYFTGNSNVGAIAVEQGDGWIAGGNMLVGTNVIKALASGYLEDDARALPERLVEAMRKAQAAGGDNRGTCSMALLICFPSGEQINLRIDDDPSPIDAMARLLAKVQTARFREFAECLPTRAEPSRAPKQTSIRISSNASG